MSKEKINPKPLDRKHCPYCGEDNFSFAKYCSGCGYEIPERLNTKQEPETSKFEKENLIPEIDKRKSRESNDYVSSLIKKYANKLISIAWTLLLILTNPSEQKHIEFVKDKIYEESKSNQNFEGALLGAMELIIGSDRTDLLMSYIVKRQNYLVFSLTVVTVDKKSDIIAIGILGMFIDLEQVENALSGFK